MPEKSRKIPSSGSFAQQYERDLLQYLEAGTAASLEAAIQLGQTALKQGLETLEMALIHERVLVKHGSPLNSVKERTLVIRKAGVFFAKAILPMEQTHRAAREVNAHLSELNKELSRHKRDILGINRKLAQEIAKREVAERELQKTRKETKTMLAKAERVQKQLQLLSRRILSKQEEERKRISRELHDVVAQMLNSISLSLLALKKDTSKSTTGLSRNISRTQRLVEKSATKVHRFARQLRPSMLDDLGLIPSVEQHAKQFSKSNNIRVVLQASPSVEKLEVGQRIALYRIIEEALTNVSRHSKASRVVIRLELQGEEAHLSIQDNGVSFNVTQVMDSRRIRHLGLVGMKERAEMLGGELQIQSEAGKGTKIQVAIPLKHRKGNSKIS